MRQKVKATQQLEHQRALEAAERNQARTKIVAEIGGAAAGPDLQSPSASEGSSIECIFKDTSTCTSSEEREAPSPTISAPSTDNNTGSVHSASQKPPTPPLPSKPLSARPDHAIQPSSNGAPTTGALPHAPFDEAAGSDPTSPPRVTRSPIVVVKPTLDDADPSALPSLELSPIRSPRDTSFANQSDIVRTETPEISSSENNDAGESPPLRSRGSTDKKDLSSYACTPEKAQQGTTSEDTPKIGNRASGMKRSSSSTMLSHPVTVIPKDLPSGKPKKKPASPSVGLPLSQNTKNGDVSAESSATSIMKEAADAEKPDQLIPANSSPSTTTLEAGSSATPSTNTNSTPSTNTNSTDNPSESPLDTSGDASSDSLLGWLGTQSDDDTSNSPKEVPSTVKSLDPKKQEPLSAPSTVKNLDPKKQEPLSAPSGARATRSQSLDVISENEPHQPERNVDSPSAQQPQNQQPNGISNTTSPGKEAVIGSFMSLINSAYNGLKIDNALDGVMEVLAEGVDKGYKEVSNMTTSFLDGPGSSSGQKQRDEKPANAPPRMGPIQIEISRSFKPRVVAYDNDENETMDGSRVSALTFETYEDYASMASMSPARATSTTNRRTPRGLQQMGYESSDTSSNLDAGGRKKGGAVSPVKEEQTWQPFEKERRFFA